MRVDIAESTSAFSSMRSEWRDLLDRCPTASVFSTFEWAWTAFTTRRQAAQPFIIKIYDGSRLVGLAPLCVAPLFGGLGNLEHLSSGGRGLADYVELLSEPGAEAAVLGSIFGALAETRSQWQVLDLPELDSRTPLPLMREKAQHAGLLALHEQGGPCYTATLEPTWEAQLQRLPSNLRETIGRKRRKLEREHNGRFFRAQDQATVMAGIDALQALQDRRWDPQQQLARRRYFDFVRSVGPVMLEAGYLDFRLIEAAGRHVAASFAFVYKGTTYHYLTASDVSDEWSRYSVGTLLTADAMQSAIEQGCGTFDMMRGDEGYKARFLGELRHNQRLVYFSSMVALSYYRAKWWARELRRQGERLYSRAVRFLPIAEPNRAPETPPPPPSVITPASVPAPKPAAGSRAS